MNLLHRGDVLSLRAPREARGHEQGGARYGVVVQSDRAMWLSTVLVAPTSTSASAAPFRPGVKVRGRATLVLVDQLTAVDPTRLGRAAGRLTPAELREVDEALRDLLALY